jgi:hypothetical protein
MIIERRIPATIGIMLFLNVILTASSVTLDLVEGQTNSTINQTSTNTTATPAMTTSPQDEASQSIRGAITETRILG